MAIPVIPKEMIVAVATLTKEFFAKVDILRILILRLRTNRQDLRKLNVPAKREIKTREPYIIQSVK